MLEGANILRLNVFLAKSASDTLPPLSLKAHDPVVISVSARHLGRVSLVALRFEFV